MTLSVLVESVSKVYRIPGAADKRAVDDVSLSVHEGERVGIIGRNGAGKTTLLQMLAAVSTPTSGRIQVNGRVNALLTLGVGLREDMSGIENIRIDGELSGRTAAETDRLMPAIIEFSGLGDFIGYPVRTYSTGMKARLAFSMLVHIDPEILIVDEALSVGDARYSTKATAKMRELTRRGKILLFVSHSMEAICNMCTRCIWIDAGKVKMDGSPEMVTSAYLDEVRTIDDEALVKRFRARILNESLADGWQVEAMSFAGSRDGPPQSLLQTREPALLRTRMIGPPGAEFRGSLTIMRLDGLVVCTSSSEAAPPFRTDELGRAEIISDLGPVLLTHGVYAAEFTAMAAGTTLARRSHLFEVIDPHPHRGGAPILSVPANIISEMLPA